jgi:CheY-like chemotaxis protein
MSHELRTPLNSLLILSDQLSKNPEGNLTSRQTEFAKTIHSSGNDLLTLINDILDLSKIESGTVVVDVSELRLEDLRTYVERTFRHVAEAKGVDFHIRFDPRLPKAVLTDSKRLHQIIKNLLSNAFKFTHQGQVTLVAEPARWGWSPDNEELNRAADVVAFSVADTGIGISAEKQQIIFEAFQQADGSTSRKYGGTGLGLAISRELSRLLGGELRLVSSPGQGSTFTLFMPSTYMPPRSARKTASGGESPAAATNLTRLPPILESLGEKHPAAVAKPQVFAALAEEPAESVVNEVGDDRDTIQPGDRVLLIVENDLGFARFLLDAARDKGYKGLVTSLGASAHSLTRDYQPHAIALDIFLPDMQGWRVLERLKNDITTRHIPVCVISTDDARGRAYSTGAMAFVAKPIQSRDVLDGLLDTLTDLLHRTTKQVLLVEPDADRRAEILNCLNAEGIQVTGLSEGRRALEMLQQQPIDCVVINARATDVAQGLADARAGNDNGSAVLTRLPVIIYGDEDEDHAAKDVWKHLNQVCAVGTARSADRLLDLVMFHLHRDINKLPESKRQILLDLHQSDKLLAGKKVLIVDDDMRNIFALSTLLEEHDMVTLSADNGRDAVTILKERPDVDIVLMDIMMPEMDGLETMRAIRKVPRLHNLPIVAVTAKAMKGDREKCIEAGAWDYLSKPVDAQQMLAVLRAWLHR